jgi:hypothetical protein
MVTRSERRVLDGVARRFNDEAGWSAHQARREAGVTPTRKPKPAPSEREIVELFDELPEPDRSIAAALAIGDDAKARELLRGLRQTERLTHYRGRRIRRPRLRARHVAGSRRR